MFEKVLISVNWSGAGVDAAELARGLCAGGGEVTLAHVHAEVPLSPDPLVMGLRKFELRQSTRALKGAGFATRVDSALSIGAPSVCDGLRGLAGMIGADLVVFGPIDAGGGHLVELSRCLLSPGSGAPGAVAIAPKGFGAAGGPIHRVGAISDGTSAGDRGVALAQRVATRLGSRLRTFEVRGHGPGPRRHLIAERRLAHFAAGVDLLVSANPAQALGHCVATALLLVAPERGPNELEPQRGVMTGDRGAAPRTPRGVSSSR